MSTVGHTGVGVDAVTIPSQSSPSHNSPTAATQQRLVTTELVFIQSSIPRGVGGPHPRVIRRKNNLYMLPRSPESPILLKTRGSAGPPSRIKDYAPTAASEIAVEAFCIASDRWSPVKLRELWTLAKRAPSIPR
ncbi:hypothetical protein HYPSUDRAFT_210303 [Hypholoma sublateritium FD-334 SS-4]|uniref:Uncharacterized protein n=1 Tax=Hypholoma sublateritium (strain FD-334 SS-4) TaxID=945553 RepID=A0A0D2LPB9_HYPSF|nr:hypothetical protein HYPSUDRAFT_210303 [Hypholoma sublateritium FD-334 SS-4]